jgi:hypothetical protein
LHNPNPISAQKSILSFFIRIRLVTESLCNSWFNHPIAHSDTPPRTQALQQAFLIITLTFLKRGIPMTRITQVSQWLLASSALWLAGQALADSPFNADRSLFIRDIDTLEHPNLNELRLPNVMNTLAADAKRLNKDDKSVTGNILWARLWAQLGNNCNTKKINGFTTTCRPNEAAQGKTPALMSQYRLISIVNRFDLRDKTDFRDCGEYRLIYALQQKNKKAAIDTFDRALIIFEGELRNPKPGKEVGCEQVARFWRNLSDEANFGTRAQKIEDFFMRGENVSNAAQPTTDRIVYGPNYGIGRGQLRVNLFKNDDWMLAELRFSVSGKASGFIAQPVKSNPAGLLFTPKAKNDPFSAQKNLLQSQFPTKIASLYGANLANIGLINSPSLNNSQSFSMGTRADEQNYLLQIKKNPTFFAAVGKAVDAKNKTVSAGDKLSKEQLVNRATTQSCAGCHQPASFGLTDKNSLGSGKSWPNSLGFVHVSETLSGKQYPISAALRDVFIPARKADLEAFVKAADAGRLTKTAKVTATSDHRRAPN